ncbi:MAG: S1C family serine protease [Verrucomicrobiia bacterium]
MVVHRIIVLAACGLLLAQTASAQRGGWRSPGWPEERARNGERVLEAFSAITGPARDSVVLFEVDENKAALGAVVDRDGLILTKASEIGGGKLTCVLASGEKLEAEVLAIDDDNDLAMVRIEARGLAPVRWASEEAAVGRWAVTPGVRPRPEAVGVVSANPRRIRPKRAIIGVLPDFGASAAQVREVMRGLGAEKAGMKAGDVVIAVNEAPVRNAEDLVSTLREYREGDTVKLRIRRDGEELELSVTMTGEAEVAGNGMARQERMNRMGTELSRRAEGFQLAIQHDGVLEPWQCGGPLLNLDGRAIGLNIARAGRIASYALPADLVQEVLERLKEKSRKEEQGTAATVPNG